MKELKEYLNQVSFLTEEDVNLLQNVRSKTLKQGECFITEGNVCKEVAFVVKGVFRSFYHSSLEEDITYCFTSSGGFVSAYSSFLMGSPTIENIEALTDAELLIISRAEITRLEESNVNWLKFLKLIAEQEYLKMEKRIFILQKETAEKKYEDLLINQPDLLQLVPLQYISSYLGITQRHLSRIRRKVLN